MNGIYAYIDNETNSIIYIGQDGNIDKNRRHKDHTSKWSYNDQQINRVLQNNPDRYEYKILKKGNFNDNLLNALEIIYIHRYSPLFNYTIGGNVLRGRNSPSYKKEMRVISNGKIGYALSYDLKNICYNKSYDFLKHLSDKFNNGEISIDTIIHLNKEDFKKRTSKISKERVRDEDQYIKSSSHNKSGYYRVNIIEMNGKPYYRYKYMVNNKRKSINAKSLKELELKVKSKGLKWIKHNMEDENLAV